MKSAFLPNEPILGRAQSSQIKVNQTKSNQQGIFLEKVRTFSLADNLPNEPIWSGGLGQFFAMRPPNISTPYGVSATDWWNVSRDGI